MDTRPTGDQPRPRGILLLSAVIFFVTGGFNLLLGEWLRAAFFLGVGFVFLKGREIDRWPKAARYLIIVVVVALSVAMFVRLIFDAKALK